MVVQCSSCLTEFELDPNKVPAAGVRARCSVCSAVISVPAPPVSATVQAAPAPETQRAPEVRAETRQPPATPVVWPTSPAPNTSSAPALSPSPVQTATDTGQRRPINPFLTRDPALRAKRLARALVSDIVAYHPARHAEGLRDGTLKTLFRDEIKKSYEEYVDQVGRDFAGSTTHFQDALNDVLASGKKLF